MDVSGCRTERERESVSVCVSVEGIYKQTRGNLREHIYAFFPPSAAVDNTQTGGFPHVCMGPFNILAHSRCDTGLPKH